MGSTWSRFASDAVEDFMSIQVRDTMGAIAVGEIGSELNKTLVERGIKACMHSISNNLQTRVNQDDRATSKTVMM